jgi:hypothetical protein
MALYIIFGLLGFGLLFGAYALISAVLRVMAEKFDELMPERMVDFAGFVEINNPKSR